MGWQSVVVRVLTLTVLCGCCLVQGRSTFRDGRFHNAGLGQEFLHPDMMASFENFGRKIDPSDKIRTGRHYPVATAGDPVKFYAPPPPPLAESYLPPSASVAAASESLPLAEAPSPPTTTEAAAIMMPMDASYAFEYSSADSSRQESSDVVGNVEGQYQYQAEDGSQFVVKYSAGAEKGFVIENADQIEQNLLRIANNNVDIADPDQYAASEETSITAESADIYFDLPTIDPKTWIQSRSYRFGFGQNGGGGGRQESADEDGTVTGSYETVDAQGQPLTVHYKAGSGIGFVILNQDQIDAAAATGSSNIVQEEANAEPLAPAQPISTVVQNKGLPAGDNDDYYDGYNSNDDYYDDYNSSDDYGHLDDYYDQDQDRSYKFDFSGDGSDRQEVSDSEGYVRGSYKYVNPEGNQIKVEYAAGPQIGFVVQNREELKASLEKATLDGAKAVLAARESAEVKPVTGNRRLVIRKRPKHAAGKMAPTAGQAAINVGLPKVATTVGSSPVRPATSGLSNTDANGPAVVELGSGNEFSFSFSSDQLDHQEVSSEDGERIGSYSYVNPLGEVVKVNYRAGINGFELLK